ncbi:MAG: winged helix-turn-helix domain-containing protein [bacterium]
MITLSPTEARRLAVKAQLLSGRRASPDPEGIMRVARRLGRLQLDPTNTVARSHLLVLWSRLGRYDLTHLDRLLWQERRLFEYRAFIVPTEEFPVYRWLMRRFPTGDTAWPQRVRTFLERNARLRRHILARLRRHGRLPSRAFEDIAEVGWQSGGWTSGRNVGQMLEFLWARGEVLVAARERGERLWDLTDRSLPRWTPRDRLSEREVACRIVERSLRAHGVVSRRHLANRYPRALTVPLDAILTDLARRETIAPARLVNDGTALKDPWYVYTEYLEPTGRSRAAQSMPRTVLLSPFDNLIHDRQRTARLFGFDFRLEIYVPRVRRRYGYFVMPILYGDRLIGRMDPEVDRARNVLTINAVHAEPDAPLTRSVAVAINGAVEDLATFLRVGDIEFRGRPPRGWQRLAS